MGELVRDQLELPIEAVEWLVNTVENKFMKKASEGGLAKDKFNTDTKINEEYIVIRLGRIRFW